MVSWGKRGTSWKTVASIILVVFVLAVFGLIIYNNKVLIPAIQDLEACDRLNP